MNICLKVYLGNFGQVFSLNLYTFWNADCISKYLLLSESDLLYEKQNRQSLGPLQLILGDRKRNVKEIWFSSSLHGFSNTEEENGDGGHAAAGPD